MDFLSQKVSFYGNHAILCSRINQSINIEPKSINIEPKGIETIRRFAITGLSSNVEPMKAELLQIDP